MNHETLEENGRQFLKALANPALAMLKVVSREGIDNSKECPPDEPRDAVVDSHLIAGNDLASRVCRHGIGSRATQGNSALEWSRIY